jgi:hypothetical protein
MKIIDDNLMNGLAEEAQPSDMADIMHVMDAAKKIMRQSVLGLKKWEDVWWCGNNLVFLSPELLKQ